MHMGIQKSRYQIFSGTVDLPLTLVGTDSTIVSPQIATSASRISSVNTFNTLPCFNINVCFPDSVRAIQPSLSVYHRFLPLSVYENNPLKKSAIESEYI